MQQISFPALTFNTPGVYEYTIRELTPSGDGWETDNRIYRAVITVVDNGKGSLVAQIDYPDGEPEFINTYVE